MPTKDCWFSLLNKVVIFEVVMPATHRISYLAVKENKQVPFSKIHKISGRQRVSQTFLIVISFNWTYTSNLLTIVVLGNSYKKWIQKDNLCLILLNKTRLLRGWDCKALFSDSWYSLICPKMLLAPSLYLKPLKLATISLKIGSSLCIEELKVDIPVNYHLYRFSMIHSFGITIKTFFFLNKKTH